MGIFGRRGIGIGDTDQLRVRDGLAIGPLASISGMVRTSTTE